MKKNMGWICLVLGGCFLWNPIIGVKDVLPDVIGYLLLFFGVGKFADLNDRLADAKKAFRVMAWVGVGQLLAWVLVSQLLQKTDLEMNRYEEPVWILVFSFAFLVLEWYFMLSGWKSFFKGLSELAEYHGGSAILEEKRGVARWARLLSATRVFVICKAILTVLPETAVLTSIEKEAQNDRLIFDLFPYSSLFRVLTALLGLVIGLLWVISYLQLMWKAMKDGPWQESLWNRYRAEILSDTGLLLNRRIHSAFACLQAGALLCINLTVLYRQILPDWCAVIMLLVGCALLRKFMPNFSWCLAIGSVAVPMGVVRAIINERFLRDEFIPAAALRSPVAYQRYLPIRLLGWGEALLILALLGLIMRSLHALMKSHTAVEYADDAAFTQRATEKLHVEMRKKALIVWLGWILMAILKILEIELQPQFGWIWMAQVAVSLAAVVLFFSYLNRLAELIEDRFPPRKRV